MKKRRTLAGLILMAAGVCVGAEEPQVLTNQSASVRFDAGGDIRARMEWKDNWPNKNTARVDGQYAEYYRFRTRIWGKADLGENLGIYARFANEFRDYWNDYPERNKNKFPDEVVIDNLYFTLKNADYRLQGGRFDMKLGSGRLVSDGTPGDGSRTEYFDGGRFTANIKERSKFDLAAVWDSDVDNMTMGNPHDPYSLTKTKSGNPYSLSDEQGVMAFLDWNEFENLGLEGYYIFKNEEDFYDKTTKYPGRSFSTIGGRVLPKFNDWLSAEGESAVQVGRTRESGKRKEEARDLAAWMLYGGLKAKGEDIWSKPEMTLACLALSGDKDSYYKTRDGSTDTGWNPVFNRKSWFSEEVMKASYDQYRWSNLVYPHVGAKFEPVKKNVFGLRTGPIWAMERDNGAESDYRGFFTQARYDFPLLDKIFGNRGSLGGTILAENLVYGDYYEHTDNPDAWWLRVEIHANF